MQTQTEKGIILQGTKQIQTILEHIYSKGCVRHLVIESVHYQEC